MKQKIFPVQQTELVALLSGKLNENFEYIESVFQVSLVPVPEGIRIQSEHSASVEEVYALLSRLLSLSHKGVELNSKLCQYLAQQYSKGNTRLKEHFDPQVITLNAKGKKIVCKTLGQQDYVEAIRKHTVTFVNGPAGTGKTYLAVALAVQAYRQGEVDKIILTRPAVEAGEKLGFLPGDLQMKVDPYMRPLNDALYDFLGSEKYLLLQERGHIEVSPLAYMRGRTLDRAFIILDEAQNTTSEQMKMFLTRIGFDSKVVITGDSSQMDIPSKQKSGLIEAKKILKNVPSLCFVDLKGEDVVRSTIVQKIIEAYERHEEKKENVRKEEQSFEEIE